MQKDTPCVAAVMSILSDGRTLSTTDLCEALRYDRTTIHDAINWLVDGGLAQKFPGRVNRFRLTQNGHDLARAAGPFVEAISERYHLWRESEALSEKP